MDFHDSADERGFRERLRVWLSQNLPADVPSPESDLESGKWLAFARGWTRKLHEAGFSGLSWPKEYGGLGLPLTYEMIAVEEFATAGAPDVANVVGMGMVGPTLMKHGSEGQKARHLRAILTGDEFWCQGFSEPGAGSDLAAASCRADRDGDSYVVNGQKIWSSFAHVADWCVLVARTDFSASKHGGLSYFLLDMRSQGVDVRPLVQVTGEAEFNEIFLTGVRIPAENLVGGEGDGWKIAITTLMNERTSIGALTVRLEVGLRGLVDLARTTLRDGCRVADDPVIRDSIAQLYGEVNALRVSNRRSLALLEASGSPGPEGSTSKLVWSTANQRLTQLALQIEGTKALLTSGPDAVDEGAWQQIHLRSLGNTIEGGTSEILLTTIAERILHLPRSR